MNQERPLLLVEDNPQDEMLILRALKKVNIGNVVDVARDGQQALDYLSRAGEFAGLKDRPLPAVVLLDINLPRVNGLEVLQRIRNDPATALLPVVMLTSSDEERDKLRGYQSGANSFVCKPLDFSEFAATVAQLGLYWMAINRLPDGS
jgi:CheY-like chemotaxis protein